MTTRSALLLNCPGDGKTFLKGVSVDIKNYKKFLLSDCGGNWNADEVKVVESPTKFALEIALMNVQLADIAYIIFCGHGYYAKPSNKQMLCVSNNFEIEADSLLKYGKRLLLITDSCQEITYTAFSESESVVERAMKVDSDPKNRRRFNSMIDSIPVGAIYQLKSCDINELSSEDHNGGFFTQALISECKTMESNRQDFNLCSNFPSVEKSVSGRTGGRQNPKISYPRSSSAMAFIFGMK